MQSFSFTTNPFKVYRLKVELNLHNGSVMRNINFYGMGYSFVNLTMHQSYASVMTLMRSCFQN